MGGGDEERAELVNEVGSVLSFVLASTLFPVNPLGPNELLIPAQQIEILKSTIQDMEKERDFYFGKLRNIELICQEKEGEGDPTLQRIVDILYATDVSSASSHLITV